MPAVYEFVWLSWNEKRECVNRFEWIKVETLVWKLLRFKKASYIIISFLGQKNVDQERHTVHNRPNWNYFSQTDTMFSNYKSP